MAGSQNTQLTFSATKTTWSGTTCVKLVDGGSWSANLVEIISKLLTMLKNIDKENV